MTAGTGWAEVNMTKAMYEVHDIITNALNIPTVGYKIKEFLIGGIAGAGATIFTNPVDVIKTRLQLQGELVARGQHARLYRGVLHGIYVVATKDGLLALQKGLAPAMIFGFCMNSVRLGTYGTVERRGWTKNENGEIVTRKALMWSCISGACSGISGNPGSVVKTRLQSASHHTIAVGRQYNYTGTLDAFKTIYKTEGLRGYFVGLPATCLRLAIGSTAQLTTFSKAKEMLLERGVCKDSPTLLAFFASIFSGVVNSLFMCPLDVVSTRLYNQGTDIAGNPLYKGVIDCLVKTYKAEGLFGLYKGVGPLYLRLAPHTALSLVIWDRLNSIIK